MNRKSLSIVVATLLISSQSAAYADAGNDLHTEIAARGQVAASQIREQSRDELASRARAALPDFATVAAAAQITVVAAVQSDR